jgi:hypothetical protein
MVIRMFVLVISNITTIVTLTTKVEGRIRLTVPLAGVH